MKKKLLFLSLVAGLLTVSCTRDWNCECTAGSTTDTHVYKDMKRSEAKEACEEWSKFPGVECELKLL